MASNFEKEEDAQNDAQNEAQSEKRTQFGSRYLVEESKVFEHNAWDDVELDEAQRKMADLKIKENSTVKMSSEEKDQLEKDAQTNWDLFYNRHDNKFFKDRHWLFTVFPELLNGINSEDQEDANTKPFHVLEIGCGVGNTVFPLLQININPNLFIYCCDFSQHAISLVKEQSSYDEKRCLAFVLDVTSQDWQVPFQESSLDAITLIFVLSAIDPQRMQSVINKAVIYLKPGGLLLFRDYGRYDLTQLRFKKGQCIGEHFYKRGDGTRVYFFEENEIDEMFVAAGLKKVMLRTDRRLQVNRARQVKMYRVWVFGKYSKL